MIHLKDGDIFASNADVIVNPVNTEGVMGKGLALEYKKRFPDNYKAYAEYCHSGQLVGGGIFATYYGQGPWVVNLATKELWRAPSRLEWIYQGLIALKKFIVERHAKTVAIPAIGCGLGGLDWTTVRNAIEQVLEGVDATILVYPPRAENTRA